MSDNEIKLVTRQETFNDLAVRELAKSRAMCLCAVQFGRCKEHECAKCQDNIRYNNCSSTMNDYDKIRLNKYINDYYMEYSRNPGRWSSFNGLLKLLLGWLACVVIIIMITYAILSALPRARPDKNDSDIINTLTLTHRYIKDINNDSTINCIDYAVSFKYWWDKYYNKNRCIFVRNYNWKTGFHHLFVKVDDVLVEPWCSNKYMYLMEDNWSNKYNPKYNIEGETKWMEELINAY